MCGCGVRSCSYQGHSKNFTELYKFKATVWIFRDFRDSRPTHKKKNSPGKAPDHKEIIMKVAI